MMAPNGAVSGTTLGMFIRSLLRDVPEMHVQVTCTLPGLVRLQA